MSILDDSLHDYTCNCGYLSDRGMKRMMNKQKRDEATIKAKMAWSNFFHRIKQKKYKEAFRALRREFKEASSDEVSR